MHDILTIYALQQPTKNLWGICLVNKSVSLTDLGLAQVIPYVWVHEPVFGQGSHTQVLLDLTRIIHMSGD